MSAVPDDTAPCRQRVSPRDRPISTPVIDPYLRQVTRQWLFFADLQQRKDGDPPNGIDRWLHPAATARPLWSSCALTVYETGMWGTL
jgi:hypothetical protein